MCFPVTIGRDEVKFAKFVGRMRKRFSYLFIDLLKTQLVLKGVVSPKEYDAMKEHIQFDYIYDNHFSELREMEMLTNRLQLAGMAEPYLGKYFSVYQVRNRMLGYTDGEIKEIDKQISYERNVGIIPDPNAAAEQQQGMAGAGMMRPQNAEISGDFQGIPGDQDMSGDAPQGADPNSPSGSVAMGGGGGGPMGGASTMPS